MPIYEYRCAECGNEFELRKSWAEETAASCPKCGNLTQKKFAVPTVVYKGSGFYTTDYNNRKSSPSSAKKSASDAPKKDGGGDSSKSSDSGSSSSSGDSSTSGGSGPSNSSSDSGGGSKTASDAPKS